MITYHDNLIQGSDEWFQIRCGMLTASEFCKILTPATLKAANNDKQRMHVWEIAAQRISNYVEPQYMGEAMQRGHDDERVAREIYSEHYTRVREVGFATNDEFGFTLGCSPDGLVGDKGMIECKSRIQKYQIQTVVDYARHGLIPEEFQLQVQGQLLVTGRQWCDFISYSGGLPMVVIRVLPDARMQNAILEAAAKFEEQVQTAIASFKEVTGNGRYIPTERRIEQEMYV